MKTASLLLVIAFQLAMTLRLPAAEQGTLDPHLEPLRPWLGKTWKSEAAEPGKGNPKIDVARWERALNGRAVRILHSIDDGAYGGETIAMWDEKKGAIVYHYFTTAGYTTTGTMALKDGKMVTNEVVSGNAGGVSEVRGTAEVAADGSFRMKTEYLKDGKWQPGRDAVYRADATATVLFK